MRELSFKKKDILRWSALKYNKDRNSEEEMDYTTLKKQLEAEILIEFI